VNDHAQTSPPSEIYQMGWSCPRGSGLTDKKSWEEELQWRSEDKATTQRYGQRFLPLIHQAENNASTTRHESSEDISDKIAKLFQSGVRDLLDDNFGPDFFNMLTSLLVSHGNDAVAAITPFVLAESVNAEVISETLRVFGRIQHLPSYKFRRWLLESGLTCSSPRIRDSASLGLGSMRDPQAIPYLQRAIQQEPSEELRQDMQSVLDHLEQIRKCLLG